MKITVPCNLPDTGGPAFAAMNETCGQDGMTLLDYFAGQVLAGQWEGRYPEDMREPATVERVTKTAYDLAAAMIAEKRRRETAR